MDSKVIKVYESFKLGYCRCGCDEFIGYRSSKTSAYLKRYKLNHHTKGKQTQTTIKNNNWKGGRTKKGDYWYIRIDGKYVLEHVYFYEQYHNVCVLSWCVVHHIDENKENNMPWNTETMMWNDHSIYHNPKTDMSDRRCSNCKGITKSDWFYDKDKNLICYRCYFKNWYKKSKNK